MPLFSGTNVFHDESTSILPEDYSECYAWYAYNLSPDFNSEDHYNLLKQGNVRLALKFVTALPKAITIVAYGGFENIIELDHSRKAIFNFMS